MPLFRSAPPKVLGVGVVVALVLIVAAGLYAFPGLGEKLGITWFGETTASPPTEDKGESATLIRDAKGRPGLRLTQEAMGGLQVKVAEVKQARALRALPAQPGTLNYDFDGLYSMPARFTGEIAEIAQVDDEERPLSGDRKKRPLRYGDKVKQGDLLAVVYSQPIGAAKAAVVDAYCSLRLSQAKLERYKADRTTFSFASVEASERQVEADTNAFNTALRSLYTWKLNDNEVKEVLDEAKSLLDKKSVRDPKEEAKKWARVEVRVPDFDSSNRDKELVIVERNTNLGAMVDPINTQVPLFRLADMNRVQIWAHPPEEYLPLLNAMLEKGPGDWDVRFQADPDKEPLKLKFFQVAPSIEPTQKSPMVIGYLPNPDANGVKHKFGEFVTVTLYVPPPEPETTVEIPTDALNEINGESLVFVQANKDKNEFFERRVVVLARFKDYCYVRGQPTKKDEELSKEEVKKGRRPLEGLGRGDLVVTRGILEMTACLEAVATKEGKK